MAQMEFDSSKKKKRRKSYFLGCFGFSIIKKKISVNKSTGGKKKRKPLFSLSKFVREHSSAAKTIPVDNWSSREIHVVKPEKVKTPATTTVDVNQVPVKGKSQTNIYDQKVIKKLRPWLKKHSRRRKKGTKDHKAQDNIIHKKNKSMNHLLDNVHDYSTCRNEFSRSVTISSSHNLSHLINSTKDKHEIKLSHSASLPPPKRKKSPAATATGKVDDQRSSQRQEQPLSDNFDSIIGMSILMVTLLIMLFWGKACAIICTCAWFYFLPRFRPKNEAVIAGKIGGIAGVDLNSEEYKKKVMLEGFLERNHRNGVGVL
ncbi:hypothetical protein RND71_010766 [Anisodus tanguticus]|uniref:Transmembrane protein n=1 Tax=Anisodus tanguticus TaxID=243964 RepID=A0AAE1VP36_9SOLA|nr:hypothetical protein RND71_010766 [Anisodus tanguticus]